jgi:hypothetical protein
LDLEYFFCAIITEGLFKHSKLTHIESYYGKVLVDAYRAEKELSGTGLYLDRRLSGLNFAFRYKQYSVNYDYVYLTQASSQSTPWLNRNVDLIAQSDVNNFPLRGCNVCSVKGFSLGRQAPSGAAA